MIVEIARKEGEFRENLKQTDWAWLAGFIDGEGHLGIRKGYTENKKKKHLGSKEGWIWYIPKLSIHNTHFGSMMKVSQMLQGNVQKREMNEHNLLPVYSIEICARKKLKLILPYLIPYMCVKAEQARILYEFVCLPRGSSSEKERLYTTLATLSQANR